MTAPRTHQQTARPGAGRHTGGRDAARAGELADRFAEVYGHAPDGVWRAPGRVNLIGEHTDYNDGFVLPFAIDRSAMVAVRLRRASEPDPGTVELASTYAPDGQRLSRARFRIPDLAPGAVGDWGAYPAGVVHVLAGLEGVQVPGFELLLDSTVPVGAGLSSSHAVEVATIVALNDLLDLGLDRPGMARLTQRAENEFVGAPTGIMDQSASLMGRAGAALFLDCRSLAAETVPLPLAEHGLAVLVIDTRVAHSHADGGYGARRASCEAGAAALGAASLREVPADADLSALDAVTARRVRHVLTENARVLATVERLRAGDVAGTGQLLIASHTSLREDYEVSCPELDLAVEAALAAGAIGARMTGGGFGGSAIALVAAGEAERTAAAVTEAFARAGHRAPGTFVVAPGEGAGRVR
ncbi:MULTISPECIES: galactokinase [unclassified Kocuria]|uniref:galactokinase n=1 Tax=unclassified Kocuria TaxID=2649579 RepID=UPI000649DDD1|nr:MULTISPECIES: galactokinase [unclassified Kocuria]KLU10084.1 galactokinase [Kocuria sp. SM24M-10]OLT06654.1 galactokinase [Kocuria sp. CNJ-770]